MLFVDDEQIITDTLVTIFTQSGYETKGVYSAEQALTLMEDWHPDLMVLDVMLPGMNGVDLAVRIRSQCPECCVSLFSGQAATADLLELAKKRGHRFDVLVKPLPPSELLEIVARLLDEPPISISYER